MYWPNCYLRQLLLKRQLRTSGWRTDGIELDDSIQDPRYKRREALVSCALLTCSFVIVMGGCQSARRLGQMVRVTKDPNAQIADVPAPEQRLATTKTSLSSQPNQKDLASAVAGMPEVFQRKPNMGQPPVPQQTTPQEPDLTQKAASKQVTRNVGAGAVQMRLASSKSSSPESSREPQKPTTKPSESKIDRPTQFALKDRGTKVEVMSRKAVPTSAANSGKQVDRAIVQASNVSRESTPVVSQSLSDLPPVTVKIPDSIQVASDRHQLRKPSSQSRKKQADKKPTAKVAVVSNLPKSSATSDMSHAVEARNQAGSSQATHRPNSVTQTTTKSLNPTASSTDSNVVAKGERTSGKVAVGGLVAASMTDLVESSTKTPAKQDKPSTDGSVQVGDLIAKEVPVASASQTAATIERAAAAAKAEMSASRVPVIQPNQRPSHDVASVTEVPPRVAKKQIPQSRHPNSLDEVLRSRLDNLPKLGQLSASPGTTAPIRIGATPEQNRVQNAQIVVAENTSSGGFQLPSEDQVVTVSQDAHVGDLSAGTVAAKPMIRQVEKPSDILNENQVRPASHAQSKITLPTNSGVQPNATPVSDSLNELSENELFEKLLARVSTPATNETPLQRERRLIIARHLMVLSGDPTAAVTKMDGLNETEQRYLKSQLLGLWTMIDPQGHPSSGRRITEALPKFREATRYMAVATDSLRLANLEFCTEIEAFGQVKPFAGNRFVAGQQVILYCEVENFAAEPNDNLYRTKLRGNYDVYDSEGTKVLSQLLPVDEQRSRNHLRDYFVAYQMNLPRQLKPGSYRLQLTIEDAIGKKYGQSDLPFEIKP